MILHGNMMAAARALLLVPRPGTPGVMLHLSEGPGPVELTLAMGDPLGGGVILDLAPPREAYHLHAGTRTDLRAGLTATLLHGAGNAARGWRTEVDLSAPGLHTVVAVSQIGRDPEGKGLAQHFAKTLLARDAEGAAAPVLGLAAEIVPDSLPAAVWPGTGFSARLLARGRPVAGAAVSLERVAAEPVAGRVRPLPDGDEASATPGWIVTETDRAGRFRVSLPGPGLWGMTASGVGPGGWSGLRRVRHDATLWLRFGVLAQPACRGGAALAATGDPAPAAVRSAEGTDPSAPHPAGRPPARRREMPA